LLVMVYSIRIMVKKGSFKLNTKKIYTSDATVKTRDAQVKIQT